MTDPRRFAPSAARNRDPILEALRPHLPQAGLLLEIASGSGEHAVHLARAIPGLVVQPSDPEVGARASIDAWAADSRLPNLRPALALDAAHPPWPIGRADAVLCINMVHIAPWAAAEGLVRGAAALEAPLFLYGPYRRGGVHTGPGNIVFDADLRARNPAWGIRALEDIAALAAAAGYAAPVITRMPADNLLLAFARGASA